MIRATLLILTLAACHHAHAAEICTPDDMHVSSYQSAAANAHGEMCIATARVLTPLVQQSGLPCNAVVGSILYPEKRTYFVTCLVVDTNQPAARVQMHYNYESINGAAFEPVP
jgi:hypothetical protein